MVRQDQVRAVREQQVVADLHAEALELAHFLFERHGVHHHPVPDDAENARVQDARGNQVQHEALPVHDHGVARVVAAVVASHHLHPGREQVDDLALALVAPLGACDDDIRHGELRILAADPFGQQGERGCWRRLAPDELLLPDCGARDRRRHPRSHRARSRGPGRPAGGPGRLGARAVRASRRVVDAAVARGDVVYGVTTGFGDLADVRIPADQLRELQLNLLRSHAAGVGAPLGRPRCAP